MKILFIGAGKMATALAAGIVKHNIHSTSELLAVDVFAPAREAFTKTTGIQCVENAVDYVKEAETILLAVKPQVMKAVCLDLAPHLTADQVIVSIAAGISCASLEKWLGERAIVRCMPNTPALLRQGVSGLFANPRVSAAQKAQAEQVLSAVGLALWLEEEAQLDAVTAVSGSGPAYFFLLIEAMTAAGEQLGLPRATAAQLSIQTALGAARMASESDVDAAELRRRVTSPNGTTEAAIKTFQAGGFEALVQQALHAAANRSAELAEQLGQ